MSEFMDGNARSIADEKMRACIEECHSCHDICTETVTHCLQMGGDHAEPTHIRLLLDCAEICQTSANFMLRTSDFHGQTCGVCADICERCTEDCERFTDDQMMQMWLQDWYGISYDAYGGNARAYEDGHCPI